MPDDPSIPPAMAEVRDLTAEEYDATYADGEPHQLPADLLEHLEAIARGETPDDQPHLRTLTAPEPLALPRLLAASYGGPFSVPAHVRVIHCTEGPMSRGNARALAGPNWFGGPAGTSAHDIFDPGEGIEMVPPDRIAWHVGPGGNGKTRGTEHCGRVAMTRDEWLSADGQEMLDRSARYNAAAARRDGVLPRWLTLTQLANGESGFATHNDVRLALGGTTHSDPGPNFPYDWYMARVQAYYAGTPLEEDDMFSDDDRAMLRTIKARVEHVDVAGMGALARLDAGLPKLLATLTAAGVDSAKRDAAVLGAIAALPKDTDVDEQALAADLAPLLAEHGVQLDAATIAKAVRADLAGALAQASA